METVLVLDVLVPDKEGDWSGRGGRASGWRAGACSVSGRSDLDPLNRQVGKN